METNAYFPKASKNIVDKRQRSQCIFKFSKTYKFVFKIILFTKYHIPTQHILKFTSVHTM